MNKILDDLKSKNTNRQSKKSFRQFIIAVSSLILALALFKCNSILALDFKYWNSLFLLASFTFLIFTILGLTNTIKSYKAKEPDSIIKRIGLFGNILLLILILYSFFISRKLFTTVPHKVENIEELTR